MAHLGNIGVRFPTTKPKPVAPAASLSGNIPSEVAIINYPVDGGISGVVQINGVVTADVVVRLYDRESGHLVKQAKTDSSGAYSFIGLNKTSSFGGYYVVFMDPRTSSPYNYTVAKDHITAG